MWLGALGAPTVTEAAVLSGGIDRAIQDTAPRVRASAGPLGDVDVAPASLGDLRPSRIVKRLPLSGALDELVRLDAEGAPRAELEASGAPAAWVQRALALREAADRRTAPDTTSAVDRLMRLVEPAPERLADAVEADREAAARALRHDADLLALRRAWRSLAWLAERLDLRGSVRLSAVSVPDLADALAGEARRDVTGALAGADLIVADADIGTTPQDADLGRALATLGAETGAPVLASATPALAGVAEAGDPVPPLRDGLQTAAWSRLRREADARWLTVAYPPVRLANSLWGGGALAVAADAGTAYAAGGTAAALGRRAIDAELSVEIPPAALAQLAERGLAVAAAGRDGVRVGAAPSAALGGSPERAAALSLPAALFAAHVARLAAGGLDGDWLGEAPYRLAADGDDRRVTLPAETSPLLSADVTLRLQAS